jgi:hypothetical protein
VSFRSVLVRKTPLSNWIMGATLRPPAPRIRFDCEWRRRGIPHLDRGRSPRRPHARQALVSGASALASIRRGARSWSQPRGAQAIAKPPLLAASRVIPERLWLPVRWRRPRPRDRIASPAVIRCLAQPAHAPIPLRRVLVRRSAHFLDAPPQPSLSLISRVRGTFPNTGAGNTAYPSVDGSARDAISLGVRLRVRLAAVLRKRARPMVGGWTPLAWVSPVNGRRLSTRRSRDGAATASSIHRPPPRLGRGEVRGTFPNTGAGDVGWR